MKRSPRLLRALGWCALIIGAVSAPFSVFAMMEGALPVARGFLLSAFGGCFIGGLVLTATNGLQRPAGASSALRLCFYGWVLIPVLAAPPLAAASGSTLAGVFEAYSSLTTTGAIVLAPEDAPRSIVLWRSVLAWLGGLASLVLAATVIAALDKRGVGLRRTSLLTVEQSDIFTNFGRAIRRLGSVYAAVTLIGAALLGAAGLPAFEALCLALSALSTSGLAPQSGPLGDWLRPAAVMFLAMLCLAGAWNFSALYELATRHRPPHGSGESRAMIILSLLIGLTAGAIYGLGAIVPAALDAVFAITTSGYLTTAVSPLPVSLLLLLALAGGSTISTSGGIKMPRLLLLARRAGGELSLLSHPSAAVRTRYAGRPVKEEALAGIWVYALAYPAALGLGAMLVAAGGAPLEDALMVSAASLTNAGPLAGGAYEGLGPFSMFSAIFLMIAGRLEVLAAAAAVFVIFSRD